MIFGNNQKNKLDAFKSMNIIQKHAEITFAESYLLKALLSIVTDSNMVTFMKEGLAIRHSYNIYKTCYKFLKITIKEGGPEALREYKIDNRFITSVYLGMGCFNLMMSIMPPRILKLFEMIGLGGNREFGMQCLALGAEWKVDEACCIVATDVRQKSAVNFFVNELTPEPEPGSRRFLCEMVLLSYHIILTTMIQLPNCNFPLAVKMLEKCISAHPNSSIYLIFKGKVSQSQRRISTAITDFKKVIEIQRDWRQLIHVCFWELGICHAAIGEWEKAAHYFDILYKENPWSKSIYLYLKAMMLYTFDSQKHKVLICESLNEIPKLLKKVAGKSIPLEVLSF
jgi:tetratricopeptide (TPR) repeat protein